MVAITVSTHLICPANPPRSLTYHLPPAWDPQRPWVVEPGFLLWSLPPLGELHHFYLNHDTYPATPHRTSPE